MLVLIFLFLFLYLSIPITKEEIYNLKFLMLFLHLIKYLRSLLFAKNIQSHELNNKSKYVEDEYNMMSKFFLKFSNGLLIY